MSSLDEWLKERRITEVECLVPDLSGVARGKILPAHKFRSSLKDDSLRLPDSIFAQTVTGTFVQTDVLDPVEADMLLRPDPATIRPVPWYDKPTAQVIVDCFARDGTAVGVAPRQVLRNVLALYEQEGWRPVVAPELEFYLVAKNTDPDYPLEPPIGRSGRPETGRQSYGIDAVNEFDPIFKDVYDYCEEQAIDIDTLIHEAGVAQVEINFNHGDALSMADQAFLFKRTVRQVAIRHGVYATFMAKPIEGEPGSAMHIHQSVESMKTGRNLFGARSGKDTRLFLNHIGGLQRNLPDAMILLAPNVNSYRRLVRNQAAPINVHWGRENRTVGFRVPDSRPEARRVENRVAGADTNPYLAIAASLACGYLGMVEKTKPSQPVTGSAYRYRANLPRHLTDALHRFSRSAKLRQVLGKQFVDLMLDVKLAEYDDYHKVISAWEREHLLLNV